MDEYTTQKDMDTLNKFTKWISAYTKTWLMQNFQMWEDNGDTYEGCSGELIDIYIREELPNAVDDFFDGLDTEEKEDKE